jgi:hypothetical protein
MSKSRFRIRKGCYREYAWVVEKEYSTDDWDNFAEFRTKSDARLFIEAKRKEEK